MHDLVVHCKKHDHDVYIGRPSHFGNPFVIKNGKYGERLVSSREEAVTFFRQWLLGEAWHDVASVQRVWMLENLHKLRGKTLGCWCAPNDCHGDVIHEVLEKHTDEEILALI